MLMMMVGVCGVECGGIIFKWRIIMIIVFNFLKSFGNGGLGRELLWEFCGLRNVDDKRLSRSLFSLLFWFWGICM
jgi:hypothetical protein